MPLPKSVGQDAADVIVKQIQTRTESEFDFSWDDTTNQLDIDGIIMTRTDPNHPWFETQTMKIVQGLTVLEDNIARTTIGGPNEVLILLYGGNEYYSSDGMRTAMRLPNKAYVDSRFTQVQSSITTIEAALSNINPATSSNPNTYIYWDSPNGDPVGLEFMKEDHGIIMGMSNDKKYLDYTIYSNVDGYGDPRENRRFEYKLLTDEAMRPVQSSITTMEQAIANLQSRIESISTEPSYTFTDLLWEYPELTDQGWDTSAAERHPYSNYAMPIPDLSGKYLDLIINGERKILKMPAATVTSSSIEYQNTTDLLTNTEYSLILFIEYLNNAAVDQTPGSTYFWTESDSEIITRFKVYNHLTIGSYVTAVVQDP